MLDTRTSGILLHITSLPSRYGIGDLGPGAYRFADFLAESDQHIWQVLPLVPLGYGASPYSSPSTFARNPLLISPELLERDNLIDGETLRSAPTFPDGYVDYPAVQPFKYELLEQAFERFNGGHSDLSAEAFRRFCRTNANWLEDYSLFVCLKEEHGGAPWTAWDPDLRSRDPEALENARDRLGRRIHMRKFWQYLFTHQWNQLKEYCAERSIRFFGDLPIYVAHDSADVWANPGLFRLDASGRSVVVAGVPPDYFSETGQRWGNPIYRWDRMNARNYRWWTRRFENTLELVDILRIDHFRGFEAYWEIPAGEETAINGEWKPGPGAKLFRTIRNDLGELPVVAENLGLITPEVTELMEQLNFPGMAVLQFGFYDAPDSEYLPHNFEQDLVAYTGTHDNNTILGWWNSLDQRHDRETARRIRTYVRDYLDLSANDDVNQWSFLRALIGSVANTVIFPLQDLLGLGADARMNNPGFEGNNWAWRFRENQLTDNHTERLQKLVRLYGRTNDGS